MTKVYVLTEGEYSDYGIVGIFSTLEKCESCRNGNPDARCEEYEVDEMSDVFYSKVYTTAILKQTGEIIDVYNYKCVNTVFRAKAIVEDEGIVWQDFGMGMKMVDKPHISVQSPISMEHAIKVAVEARQKWLRESAHAQGQQG